MAPQEFIAKWRQVNLTERSACQQHFLVLVQPKPAAADPKGAWYTFERGVRNKPFRFQQVAGLIAPI